MKELHKRISNFVQQKGMDFFIAASLDYKELQLVIIPKKGDDINFKISKEKKKLVIEITEMNKNGNQFELKNQTEDQLYQLIDMVINHVSL